MADEQRLASLLHSSLLTDIVLAKLKILSDTMAQLYNNHIVLLHTTMK